MQTGDTIVAIASASGRSARGVIRLSGDQTDDALRGVLAQTPLSRGAHRVRVMLGKSAHFPALLIRYKATSSYTGEDAAEMILPGSPALLGRVCDLLIARCDSVRPAEPGEFTARAFLRGRLTAEQAEGVAMTIAARTNEQLQAAAKLVEGSTGARYRRVADRIAAALALVEAGVDFTDQEDVVAITPGKLIDRLRTALDEVVDLLGAEAAVEQSQSQPVIALVGAPNAGKSTLFNALLGRRRSVVSGEAGTTRDAVTETIDLSRDTAGGGELSAALVDMAGLDDALIVSTEVDRQAQQAALQVVASADVVVLCDPFGQWRPPAGVRDDATVIRLRTKADLPCAATDEAPLDTSLAVCALDGWRLASLRRALADAVGASRQSGVHHVAPRHRSALRETSRWLRDAITQAQRSEHTPQLHRCEIIAGALRLALDAIGQIAGDIDPDDIIGRIFATFCVGK